MQRKCPWVGFASAGHKAETTGRGPPPQMEAAYEWSLKLQIQSAWIDEECSLMHGNRLSAEPVTMSIAIKEGFFRE
jgi:hypothetical protein